MKRLLTLSWLLCLTVGIVNAHILSKPEYSKHPSRAPINIDVSLMDRYSRTYTEQQLLDQYVAVFKSAWAKNLLFVVDDQDRVALFDKDGNQLLPFLEGKPRVLFGYGNFVVLGDQSTNDEWEAFFDEIRASYATTRRMTVGNCAAVYSIDAKKVLMNDGEFDYITCTFKYPKIYFYVARYNENDSLKWGLYSTKKVLLPCEYNYVTHTPKPKGDNSKDMWAELNRDRINLAVKQSNRQKRQAGFQTAAQILGGVGSVMVSAGSVIQTIQPSASSSMDSGSATSSSSTAPSKSSAKSNSSSDATNKNADARTYSDYESQLIQMNTYYADRYNDATRRNIQSKMKAIRTKWEQRGFQMFHSPWEDWDGRKK